MIPGFNSARLSDIAAQTPASRDRYADFLRAFSIGAVVVGHWLSALLIAEPGGIKVRNAAGAIPGMWLATWFFQVMPLFFFVGGFSNLLTFNSNVRRGGSAADFFRSRFIRLFRPTRVFLGVWLVIIGVVSIFFHWWQHYALAAAMIFGPLWFLAVYSGVIVATPLMLKLHRRLGWAVPAILIVLVALVDFLHFGCGVPYIRWLNLAFVWLFIHQLGFFYAEGKLKPRGSGLMAAAGLAGLILLTNFSIYPRSMVGTGFEKISNMNPPTICIALLALWQIGAAMLLRLPMNRWLNRRGPWMAVIWVNSVIMTIYLWHLTAYAAAYLIFLPTGLARSTRITAGWWLQRPLWIAVPSLILFALIAVFGRFERAPRPATGPPAQNPV
jgi:hypothetical protein